MIDSSKEREPPQLLPVEDADLEAVLALNQAAVPHVGSVDLAAMRRYKSIAAYFKVAWMGRRRAGFLIAMTPLTDYASPNFQWFVRHYRRFFYIDRVVVAPEFHRTGIGRCLYDEVRACAAPYGLLTCEVNLKPPNEHSMAFHRALGFEPLGTMDSDGGSKRVCFMGARIAHNGDNVVSS